MTRGLLLTLLGVLGAVTAASSVRAQHAHVGIGGGVIIPIDEYGHVDNTGWHASGMVEFALPAGPLAVRVDGLYGQTSNRSAVVGGHTKLAGGTADLVWRVVTPARGPRPYVLGGVGVYHVNVVAESSGVVVDTSETRVALTLGLGVTFGAFAKAHGFIEGRWVNVRESGGSTTFVPITAGVRFGV